MVTHQEENDLFKLNSVIAALGISIVLAACAAGVTSEVTRFHRGAPPQGETVAIVPLDEAKQGSLEFAAYSKMVADKLNTLGYRVVTPASNPDLLAKIDYQVGTAQTRIKKWSGSFVHYHFYRGHFHPWYFGSYWDEPLVYAQTVFMRRLDLVLAGARGDAWFEGHVRSVGRNDNLNEIMPYLVAAMFHNFPGESGVTKVVTIRKDGEAGPY
jgi:hypothetical protein